VPSESKKYLPMVKPRASLRDATDDVLGTYLKVLTLTWKAATNNISARPHGIAAGLGGPVYQVQQCGNDLNTSLEYLSSGAW
jgi:hypothetical protein